LALSAGRLRAGTFAVVALPDARAGHRLVPVFEAGVGLPLAEDTLAAYQAAAPGYARLAAPVWLERLPRSGLGKLRRRELAELLR
jgi:acyl-CoA synthetase (AMP-forming)/AMP-acid ligase II